MPLAIDRTLRLAAMTCLTTVSSAALADGGGLRGSGNDPSEAQGWSGFYAGLNAGYGFAGNTMGFYGDGGAGGSILHGAHGGNGGNRRFGVSHDIGASGANGGIQAGYNWQLGHAWLAGLEMDFQFSGARDDLALRYLNGGVEYGMDVSRKMQWFGTLRGRLGMLLSDRLMVFATGGMAYGKLESSASISNISNLGHIIGFQLPTNAHCPAMAVCLADKSSGVAIGWTVGGGVELALTPRVTLKAEYLFVDLGDQSLRLVTQPPASGSAFVTSKFENEMHVVRGGINYRF